MKPQTRQTPERHPTNPIVGTVPDAARARAAFDALLQAGFERKDVDILHGEEDMQRLGPTGAEHGVLEQFQRTLIRVAGPVEEDKHLMDHVDDRRDGRFVIMVLAKRREQRMIAVDYTERQWRRVHRLLRQMWPGKDTTGGAVNRGCGEQ